MFPFFEHPLTQALLTLIVMIVYFEFRIKRKRLTQKAKNQNILDAIIDHFKETTELKTDQLSDKQVYAKVKELMKEANKVAKDYDPKIIWSIYQRDIPSLQSEIENLKTRLDYYLETTQNGT